MLGALDCYNKWVAEPTAFINGKTGLPLRVHQLASEGKIASTLIKQVKGDQAIAVQNRLKACSKEEQYERDVGMWYGYCNSTGKGAAMLLRIFAILKTFGVMYKADTGVWEDAADLNIPVASLLSHGGRILILLPMSNSASREIGNKALTFVKGLVYDPVAALGNRGMYHTMRSKSTAGAVVGHGLLRLTGLASLGSILATPHKTYTAGDDRLWSWLTHGDMHDRGLATHSTVQQDWSDLDNVPGLRGNRKLWFSEEKAGGASNLRDGLMGRHHYKNVALGGVGNVNSFSGVKVDKDGSHGHLYVNYRAPQYKRFGCLLLGVEGSAPGMGNQYGKVHDANATKGEWSATGGKKWGDLIKLYSPAKTEAANVTSWVCDMSAMNTSAAKGAVEATKFGLANLSDMPNRVIDANWDVVVSRI